MKKIYLLFIFVVLAGIGFGQTTDLIISEYSEGSSNNKYIEIYNGTGSTVSLDDYKIWKISNGGSWPETTINFTSGASILDGDVYVIANGSSDATILAAADQLSGSMNFNGDDAMGLAKDILGTLTLIDAVGEEGPDPGSGWDVAGTTNATKDHTLVRKDDVCSPNTDWDNSRGTNTTDSEWVVYAQDTWTYIGAHTGNCSGSGPNNPTAFTATTASTSQIDLGWTQNGNSDDVMIAWTSDGTFGTPIDGSSYSVGDPITGGGTVIYNGSGTSYNHTGLNAATQYYYKAWSVDGSTEYSSGVTDDATTYKNEPSNHVTAFAAGSPTASSIPLTWTDNDGSVAADNFLIMVNTTGIFADPVDGTPQLDDTDISDGSGKVNVAHATEAYTFTGLDQSTTYYFKIWPYTNSGSAIDYKIDGTVPTDNETTTGFTTNLPYSETFDTDLNGVNTYNVSGATKEWLWVSGGYAGMNGYNSGDIEEDWLFLPGIDMDSYSNEYMTFDTWYKYGSVDNDNYLKLMYSSDYSGSGDPSSATWTELSYIQPSTAETWTSSGQIDLSAISGSSVYIALKYRGTSGSYRNWNVDNISVDESSTDPEPTNYPTSFVANAGGASSITNTWTDASGAQLPSAYIVYANLTGTFTPPVDGTPVADDTDMSDGSGAVNINYATETYQWTGLTQSTQYYFTIYPYTNSGAAIDYKTDGSAPTANATTTTANTSLIITEVADPGGTGNYVYRFVELMNTGASTIDFDSETWYLCRQIAGGNWQDVLLSGTIASSSIFVVASSQSDFTAGYGFAPDQSSSSIAGTGDDGFFLYRNGDHSTGTLIDAFGEIDVDGSDQDWEYTDAKAVRLRSVTSPNSTWTSSEWHVSNYAEPSDMTPAEHKSDVTWQGTTDTDWNTKGNNWSGTNGYIPDASFNVSIASQTNDPVISDESACNNLTLLSDAVLTINPDKGLTVDGNLSIAATRAAASLILESSTVGNGSIIIHGNVNGTATAKRYFEQYTGSNDGWHFISSPVNNMTISSSDFDPTGTNNDLFAWDEDDYLWRNYKGSNFPGTTLQNGLGYMVAYESNVTNNFVGTLNNTDVTFTNLSKTPDPMGDGWHLLGNPFPSAIYWNDGNWALTNVGGVAKVYDEQGGSYMDISANGVIPSTNGFFVQVSDASNSITIPIDSRLHSTSNNYKNTTNSSNLDETLTLLVNNDANGFYDRTTISFRDDAESTFDWDFDSHKMFGQSTAPQIWTLVEGEEFSTNSLPHVYESLALPMNFKAGVNSTFHILAEGIESFYLNSEIYLEDLQTGNMIDLRDEPMYTFTAKPTDNNSRFMLHFFGVTNVNEIAGDNNLIYAYSNKVFIKSDELNAESQIEVFDAMGRKVLSKQFTANGLNSFTIDKPQGIYIVRLQMGNLISVKKVSLK